MGLCGFAKTWRFSLTSPRRVAVSPDHCFRDSHAVGESSKALNYNEKAEGVASEPFWQG
jgi:hypothetical protein